MRKAEIDNVSKIPDESKGEMIDSDSDSAEKINETSSIKKVKFDDKIDANDSAEDDVDNEEKNKKEKKAGVIYLSRIPTKMNVRIIREYFSQYGEVDRIFLEPREKKRKSEQRTFSEGWVEFKRRKKAKHAAEQLNNKMCGGKRKNPWYSELWNIKYLKKFRWTHLNERMAYEQELRKQKLRQEVALAKKETSFYIENFEKNERKKRLDKKNNKSDESSANLASTTTTTPRDSLENSNEAYRSNRPKLYERKTKVTGNSNFLSQIFS